jgi:hypothetical protein
MNTANTNLDSETAINGTLEAYIDRHGLTALMVAIQTVCDDKSIHVQEAWQDRTLAREWQRAGSAIYTAASKIQALDIP